jgi:hypothetical protein
VDQILQLTFVRRPARRRSRPRRGRSLTPRPSLAPRWSTEIAARPLGCDQPRVAPKLRPDLPRARRPPTRHRHPCRDDAPLLDHARALARLWRTAVQKRTSDMGNTVNTPVRTRS